jgi:hypothetical protein
MKWDLSGPVLFAFGFRHREELEQTMRSGHPGPRLTQFVFVLKFGRMAESMRYFGRSAGLYRLRRLEVAENYADCLKQHRATDSGRIQRNVVVHQALRADGIYEATETWGTRLGEPEVRRRSTDALTRDI